MINKGIDKVFLLLAVLIAALCLISCGCTSQAESSADATAPADTPVEKPGVTGDGVPPEKVNEAESPVGDMPAGGNVRTGPDLASAAATLGVTEEELTAALGDPAEGETDLDAAAAALGVTVEELEAALGPAGDMPAGGAPAGAAPPGNP